RHRLRREQGWQDLHRPRRPDIGAAGAAHQSAEVVDDASAGAERPPRFQTFRRPGREALQSREAETDVLPQPGGPAQTRRIDEGAEAFAEVSADACNHRLWLLYSGLVSNFPGWQEYAADDLHRL